MNKLGINLWNWAPGLSDACCGLPTKAAEMELYRAGAADDAARRKPDPAR